MADVLSVTSCLELDEIVQMELLPGNELDLVLSECES